MLIHVKNFVFFLLLAMTLAQGCLGESAARAPLVADKVFQAVGVSASSYGEQGMVALAVGIGEQFQSVAAEDADADASPDGQDLDIGSICWGIALFFSALSIAWRLAFVLRFGQSDAPPLLPPPRLSRHRL